MTRYTFSVSILTSQTCPPVFGSLLLLLVIQVQHAGSEEYNWNLSQQRAESVTKYLVSKGISNGRFTTKWYGETQPRESNETAAGKAKNSRVELAIMASEELKEEAYENTN